MTVAPRSLISRRGALVAGIVCLGAVKATPAKAGDTVGVWLRSVLPGPLVADLLAETHGRVAHDLLAELPGRSAQDFDGGRVVLADGWMLSRAECAYHLAVEEGVL